MRELGLVPEFFVPGERVQWTERVRPGGWLNYCYGVVNTIHNGITVTRTHRVGPGGEDNDTVLLTIGREHLWASWDD